MITYCPDNSKTNAIQMSGPCFKPTVVWDPEVHLYLSQSLPNFDEVSRRGSVPPKTSLRCNTLTCNAQEVLEELCAQGSPQGAEAARIHEAIPQVIVLPTQGPNEVDYSLAEGREVLISRKAGEAVLRGAPVYVKGVVAASKSIKEGQLVAVTVAMEQPGRTGFGITRGAVLVPEEMTTGANSTPAGTPATGKWNQSRMHLHVGLGRACMDRAQMFHHDMGVALQMEQPVFRVQDMSAYERTGKAMLQNLPSVVAALALSPKAGSRVLDMCAAPGGKTTMLAQLMHNKGSITALDRTHVKVQEIMSLALELGVTCVQAYKMDATKAVLTESQESADVAKQQQQGDASGPMQAPAVGTATALGAQNNAVQGPGNVACLEECVQGAGTKGPDVLEATAGKADALNAKVAARMARKQAARMARGLDPTPQRQRHGFGGLSGAAYGLRAGTGDDDHHGSPNEAGAPDASIPLVDPPGFASESFDYVLLDAPCSALGLRPRLLQTATVNYLLQCGLYTRKLLDTAVQLIKPGGRMVFSTCTISPWENEASVRYILDKYSGVLTLIPALPRVGGPGLTGKHPSGGLARRMTTSNATGSGGGWGRGRRRPAGSMGMVKGEAACAGGVSVAGSTGAAKQDVGEDVPVEGLQLVMAEGASAGEQGQEQGKQGTRVEEDEVWLTEEEAQFVQRFDPAGPQDTIGFFVAAFEKVASVHKP